MDLNLPYLLDNPSKPAGSIKQRYEDFVVEEELAYAPSGIGHHVFVEIEKSGLTTTEAVRSLAGALNVPRKAIGYAGQKDAGGSTRQTLSVENADPDVVAGISVPRLKILSVARHNKKLRLGHMRGNRFIIKLRDIDVASVSGIAEALAVLSRRGVPNYYGPQRFGNRGDTWEIGQALLRDDFQAAAELIAGRPGPLDAGAVLDARQLFADGEYDRAADAWPQGFANCVRVCRVMAQSGGNPKRAVLALNRDTLAFYVFAYQSWLFNQVVAARIHSLDRVETGDIAYKHDSGAAFLVEDAELEQPRAERFEISPTGPLFGPRMLEPKGSQAELEDRVVAEAGEEAKSLDTTRWIRRGGERRALRFQPGDAGAEAGDDTEGSFIEIRFSLPSGCYATTLLRELYTENGERDLTATLSDNG